MSASERVHPESAQSLLCLMEEEILISYGFQLLSLSNELAFSMLRL